MGCVGFVGANRFSRFMRGFGASAGAAGRAWRRRFGEPNSGRSLGSYNHLYTNTKNVRRKDPSKTRERHKNITSSNIKESVFHGGN